MLCFWLVVVVVLLPPYRAQIKWRIWPLTFMFASSQNVNSLIQIWSC